MYTHMLITAISTILKRRKLHKCSSKNERINDTWVVHTTEYYSALKRKTVLMQATMWMSLKGIRLGEHS